MNLPHVLSHIALRLRSLSRTEGIALLLGSLLLLAGCEQKGPAKLSYDMGERVVNGPLTYVVVESSWRTQLGEGFQVRAPEQRFLMLTISITNGGGSPLSVPLLELVGVNGKPYQELSDGTGVPNWIGLLRTIDPAQTLQGNVLFDVPLASFKLRLPNGGEVGEEQFVTVDIPLRIDSDSSIQPVPGAFNK